MLLTCSFPLYYEAKLIGLIWLMAPKTKVYLAWLSGELVWSS